MLTKCKDCAFYSKPYKTHMIRYKPRGHYRKIGWFKKIWVKDEGFEEIKNKINVPGKCKRYPKHTITDPEHECGEGMIINIAETTAPPEEIEMIEAEDYEKLEFQ